jgi:septum formation protein
MLVLASKSPRRREILTNAGIPFVVRTADVPEVRAEAEDAVPYALRLAREKAEAVAAAEDEVVLGADTVVVLHEHILEKPADEADARRMLRLLVSQRHEVVTAVCLRQGERILTGVETTGVSFGQMSEAEIAEYVASGEPKDKAGGYAIQGLASKFIVRVEGCYFNVVGLPIALVYRLLKRMAG